MAVHAATLATHARLWAAEVSQRLMRDDGAPQLSRGEVADLRPRWADLQYGLCPDQRCDDDRSRYIEAVEEALVATTDQRFGRDPGGPRLGSREG